MRPIIALAVALTLILTSGVQAGVVGGPNQNHSQGRTLLGTIQLKNGRAQFSRIKNMVTIDTYMYENDRPFLSHTVPIELIQQTQSRWSAEVTLGQKLINLHLICMSLLSAGTGHLASALQTLTSQNPDPVFSTLTGGVTSLITLLFYFFPIQKKALQHAEISGNLTFSDQVQTSTEVYGNLITIKTLNVGEFVENLKRIGLIPESVTYD